MHDFECGKCGTIITLDLDKVMEEHDTEKQGAINYIESNEECEYCGGDLEEV